MATRHGDRGEPNRLAFSKTRLAELPAPQKSRRYFYDTKTPGLAFCVTSTGARNFYFCRKVKGQSIRTRMGPFPGLTVEQARKLAVGMIGGVAEGKDPRRTHHDSPTLQDLFDYWIEHAKLHKRTWQDDRRQFEKYVGRLRNRRLAEITTADIARLHTALGRKHGPYMANRVRTLVSAMFGKAHEIGYAGRNPCEGVKRFKEQSRERFLLPEEMRPFFEALAGEPADWRDFWLLCLFTGARRGNVAAMTWGEIDLEAGVWYLSGQKTKNGLPVAIVLPPPAVSVLRVRSQNVKGKEWVFPAKARTGHLADPRKSWARVLKRSGLTNLRPHDLRRSLGSWQAMAGSSLPLIGGSLGHRDPKSTMVYARLQLAAIRESVGRATQAMLEAANEKGADDGDE